MCTLPDQAAVEEALLGFDEVRDGALLHAHLHDPLRLAHRLHDIEALHGQRRHRLFDEDILAGVQASTVMLRVPVVGRGHDHRVDVFPLQQFPIVVMLVGLRAGPLLGHQRRGFFPALIPRIAQRDDVSAACGLCHANQMLAAAAVADDSQPHAVVGAQNTRRRGRGSQEYSSRRIEAHRQLREPPQEFRASLPATAARVHLIPMRAPRSHPLFQ